MLPRQLQTAKIVFKGKRFDVARTKGKHPREIVVHPGAVVILPLLDDKTVALIRNERVAVGQTLWELPAGTLEPGEPPLKCAKRELIEETGYKAARVRRLTTFFTSPGICTEVMHAFVARGLTEVGQDLDDGEAITVEAVELARAYEMIESGTLRDGKSIATLLFHRAFSRLSGGG
jgi:ADP-ribose pyrophosphatase